MERSINDICEELDSLSLRALELMQRKVCVTVELEKLIRDGHIELAKARYIRGKESIGTLQIPQNDEMSSLFELETTSCERRGKEVPAFDISRKTPKEDGRKSNDPIKWFGVLVPQNMRNAQKRFQESLYLAVEAANINSELECIPDQLKDLRALKSTLIK